MKIAVFLLLITISAMAFGQIIENAETNDAESLPTPPTPTCPPCQKGDSGSYGNYGPGGKTGIKGSKGNPAVLSYRGSPSHCKTCPTAKRGEEGIRGTRGEPGHQGETGIGGIEGDKGELGLKGFRGLPGRSNDNVMYLPYKPGKSFEQVCYSFRTSCYVPGLRNGWRAWFREGQSGFMVHRNWMYFVTLSHCPCKYTKPVAPQPVKPSDCSQGVC